MRTVVIGTQVEVTQEMRDLAAQHYREREKYIIPHFRFDDPARNERLQTDSFIGEMAVRIALGARWDDMRDGYLSADEHDLKLGDVPCDVKTTPSNYDTVLYNNNQLALALDRYGRGSLVLWGRIAPTRWAFLGQCRLAVIAECPIRTDLKWPARSVSLSLLGPLVFTGEVTWTPAAQTGLPPPPEVDVSPPVEVVAREVRETFASTVTGPAVSADDEKRIAYWCERQRAATTKEERFAIKEEAIRLGEGHLEMAGAMRATFV